MIDLLCKNVWELKKPNLLLKLKGLVSVLKVKIPNLIAFYFHNNPSPVRLISTIPANQLKRLFAIDNLDEDFTICNISPDHNRLAWIFTF